ncbi:MAG: hypothetical protein KUG71_02385 [Porticoccaceae bacterium]|nr:hypothetical protein [Porticoccaceae bacterium]
MTESEAFLECRCGACRITLCDPTVRFHIECLCFDCRQRGLISASKNPGNSLPDAVANFERGVDLVYFANALTVDEASRELLEFSKLRADAFNTTMMSTCCGTLLCGTHPLYEGTTISVNTDSCLVTTSSNMSLQVVVFACDIPDEHAAPLVRRSTVPVIFSFSEEFESPAIKEFMSAVTAPVSASASATATTNFEKLCAAKPLTIDNAYFIESRAGKP